MLTRAEILETVKKLARTNYTKGGDVIVECYTDSDIMEDFGASATSVAALEAAALEMFRLREEAGEECAWGGEEG